MIDLDLLMELVDKKKCLPGDAIFTGTNASFGKGPLIQYGQKPQTHDGKPSKWKHILRYIDSKTIAESTIDSDSYSDTMKKWFGKYETGVQYNHLETIQGDKNEYGVLVHYKLLTNVQRQLLLNQIDVMVKRSEAGDPEYRYDITGLFGSLLTYWIFRGTASNPLGGYGLYCSAFSQKADRLALGSGYDAGFETDKNTSPERLWQFCKRRYDLFELTDITSKV